MELSEKQAIDTILQKGVKFRVRTKVFGREFKVPFKIRPLHLGTILMLSRQRQKLKEVYNQDEALWEMFEGADNVKVFARCIAIAVLNDEWRICLFTGILSRFFLWNLSVKEVNEVIAVVTTQMNARDFFFTTALVKGFEIVTRKDEQSISAKKQSGEQSGKSQKN